jgi:aminoglycoside phosphotransferase (APT) family kinase protein
MSLGVAVPSGLLAQLRLVEPVGPLSNLEATFGGFSNLTFSATTIHGERVIIKATADDRKRADVKREQRMLAHLSDTDLPVPRVLTTSEAEWTVSVLYAIDATAGLHVVQSRDASDLARRITLLTRLLRRVHQTPPPLGNDPDFDIAVRHSSAIEGIAALALTASVSQRMCEALAVPVLQSGVALVHGDSGLHNTMWDDRDTKAHLASLIDWEWSGWGNPLTDIAWLWWTMRFRHLPTVVFETAVETYGREALVAMGWNEENVIQVVRAHMAQILLRTEPGSAGFDEWLKRESKLAELSVPVL